ncbi:MAG: hypothetical protein COA79_16365 [Planctomycetota bacterium]|nr:MAG: hypothetical protein COA79_16365 [Planctomycetota bacterium]
MTRKVYQDYLAHLDAYLLNGVNEIGAQFQNKNEIELIPSLGNITSDLLIIHEGPAYHNHSAFLSDEETTSLSKILNSINKSIETTYITCINKSKQLNKQELKNLILKEIESSSSNVVLCLGAKTSQFMLEDKLKSYQDLSTWDELVTNNKTVSIVTIPSLSEMKADPSLKRPAWEQLKKLSSHIQ